MNDFAQRYNALKQYASALVTYGVPVATDTVVVNGTTLTCVAAAPGAFQFSSIVELESLIEAIAGINSSQSSGVITLNADAPGIAGNALTLALGVGNTGTMAISGALFTGGVASTVSSVYEIDDKAEYVDTSFEVEAIAGTSAQITFTIQVSDDNKNWTDLEQFVYTAVGRNTMQIEKSQKYFRCVLIFSGINTTVTCRIHSVARVGEIANNKDDTAFTPATSKGVVIMGQADEVATDEVNEGDAGAVRISLRRALKIDSDTSTAGEDLNNGWINVSQTPSAASTNTASRDTSTALEASSIAKAAPGNFYQAYGVIDKSAATALYYVLFLNSATLTADGAVTHLITPTPVNHVTGTDSKFDTGRFDFGVSASAGIVIVLSTTMVTKTIAGAYLFATVTYK